jgi:hypothetical protein
MHRRASDIGMKVIDPYTKSVLKRRIDTLATAGKISPDMAEWAQGVRLGGNDAMHDPDEIGRPELDRSPRPTRNGFDLLVHDAGDAQGEERGG